MSMWQSACTSRIAGSRLLLPVYVKRVDERWHNPAGGDW